MEARLARLARRQYGVVSRAQLRELGLGDGAITARVARGGLLRVHHGVYAVGHSMLVVRGRWMAAVLAGGPHAVLSHATAGALWELRASEATIVDITLPGTGGRSRKPGIRVHRARSLDGHTAVRDGIPVTTPARTIVDLAARLDRRGIERVLDQAENTRLTDVASLEALARAQTGHKGARKLLTTLYDHEPGTTLTASELEERFLKLCREAELPRPLVNHRVVRAKVDFVFPDHRLLVETDSWRWHRSRRSFEADRRRDAAHAVAGWQTLRFTHDRIAKDATGVAATIRAVIYRGASA